MILYHVTTKDVLNKILEKGIEFGSSPLYGYQKDRVYLTDKVGAKIVAEGWVCGKIRHPLEKGKYPFQFEAIVLKVDVPKTWIKVGGKEEYLMNPYAKEYWSSRRIPPSRIVEVYSLKCRGVK